jgi:hypothetical protein
MEDPKLLAKIPPGYAGASGICANGISATGFCELMSPVSAKIRLLESG